VSGRQVTGTFNIAPTCGATVVTLAAFSKASPGYVFPQTLVTTDTGTFGPGTGYTLTLLLPACGFNQIDLVEDLTPADLPQTLTADFAHSELENHYNRAGAFSDVECPGQGAASPRTIGYWKNHASCASSNGNQAPVLDQMLAIGPIQFGSLTIDTCQEAVAILNKSDVLSGKKRASDPAYNMAAQLLGAILNERAGAVSCANVANAISAGQTLLTAVGFTGTGATTMTPAQAAQANALASFLDDFNNGNNVC